MDDESARPPCFWLFWARNSSTAARQRDITATAQRTGALIVCGFHPAEGARAKQSASPLRNRRICNEMHVLFFLLENHCLRLLPRRVGLAPVAGWPCLTNSRTPKIAGDFAVWADGGELPEPGELLPYIAANQCCRPRQKKHQAQRKEKEERWNRYIQTSRGSILPPRVEGIKHLHINCRCTTRWAPCSPAALRRRVAAHAALHGRHRSTIAEPPISPDCQTTHHQQLHPNPLCQRAADDARRGSQHCGWWHRASPASLG